MERQPHAILNLPSRRLKALKIERLLGLDGAAKSPLSLLEIGTGSGGIAHYFAHHDELHCDVTAVDVLDQRVLTDGYHFELVKGTALPFPADSFDVVITNHVIEHVGDIDAQYHHLMELKRVLRTDGVAYLAVPNRWMLVEPHYRLIFLSWLPVRMRTPYLRFMKKDPEIEYDCNPPSKGQIEAMFQRCGLAFSLVSTPALRETLRIESPDGVLVKAVAMLPDALLDRISSINPTLIYLIKK